MIRYPRTVVLGIGFTLTALVARDNRAQQSEGVAGRVKASVPSAPQGVATPGQEGKPVNRQGIGAREQEMRRTIQAHLDRLQHAIEQESIDLKQVRQLRDELA